MGGHLQPWAVRPFRPDDLAACEAILRSLPEWFGKEEANQGYVRDFQSEETHVAVGGGRIAGVLTLKTHTPYAAEVSFLAVGRDLQRQGVGRALIDRAEVLLIERGVEYLQVKTRGPSAPDPNYEKTRAFYEAIGFRALEEFPTLWDEANPALVYVKAL